MQTFSEENYLKAIYRLGAEGIKISPTAIADALKHNPASVVDMLKKLRDKKLIHYDKRDGARLTAKGEKAATEVVRKHRLWEVFLLEKLGYHWDEVHDIAEQLEHVGDGELSARLDKFLGYPTYDPHGDPIPTPDGHIINKYTRPLSEMAINESRSVATIRDSSSPFLHYLQKLGIGIGTKIKMIEKIAFDNSLEIQIGNRKKITVSKKFGENILVE